MIVSLWFSLYRLLDYHGAWEKVSGHVSPLYGKFDDKYPQYNTDFTIQLIKNEGADPKKIIVGVPFYGQVRNDSFPIPALIK